MIAAVARECEPPERGDVDADRRFVKSPEAGVEDDRDDNRARVAQLVVASQQVQLAVVEDVAALHLHADADVGPREVGDAIHTHVAEGEEDVQRRAHGELGPDQPFGGLADAVCAGVRGWRGVDGGGESYTEGVLVFGIRATPPGAPDMILGGAIA